jgi:hypothetical protein
MKIRFIIQRIGHLKENSKNNDTNYTNDVTIGYGMVYIMNDNNQELMSYEAQSGGWGNGMLEPGNYEIRYMSGPGDIAKHANPGGYTLFNFGFFAALTSLFKTSRTDLGIHPDGGCGTDGVKGYFGTLGCIGVPFKTLDDTTRFYNLLRDGLELKGKIPVEVMQILEPQR